MPACTSRPVPPVDGNPERTLLRTGNVSVGLFRCSPSYHDFRRAGRITRHCFVFPRRAVWIQHEGDPPFVADPTRVTLYNPGQPYERRALDPVGDHGDWITVSEAIARDIVAQYDEAAADSTERVFRQAHAPAQSDVYLAARRLHEYVRRTPAPDVLYVEECAMGLLNLTCGALYGAPRSGLKTAPLSSRHRERVEAVRARLNRTFTENDNLTAIADAVDTSVFHLCRIFRRGSGMTLHAYRHGLRLRNALERLEQPDADLLTLALDLGYSGHSHFTAAFHREFGLAPSRLRDQMLRVERGGAAACNRWRRARIIPAARSLEGASKPGVPGSTPRED